MTRSAASRFAWTTVALTALLTAACAAIQLTNPPSAGALYPQFPGFVEAFSVGVVGAIVGALIVSRHPATRSAGSSAAPAWPWRSRPSGCTTRDGHCWSPPDRSRPDTR